ncbi:hypothetical protein FOA52_007720 [Chlamydomonas sp. UWO 241]|nr:hypothetical protein FOA52_007720 [Chlamydomonas sp. UWO 241]
MALPCPQKAINWRVACTDAFGRVHNAAHGPGLLTAKSFKHGTRGPAGLQDLASLQDCTVNSRDLF